MFCESLKFDDYDQLFNIYVVIMIIAIFCNMIFVCEIECICSCLFVKETLN